MNHKHTFGRLVTARMLKSCSFLAHCTPSPSFMNARRGIPLFRYIGRQCVLLVSIIRRKTKGLESTTFTLSVVKYFILSTICFIKEIGTIQTLIFKYCSFFQHNVYNSQQINNFDRFGTQMQGSFFLLESAQTKLWS